MYEDTKVLQQRYKYYVDHDRIRIQFESGFCLSNEKKQSWGVLVIILGELGSTGNYFRGAGEQAHSLGDLRSPAKK